MEKYRARLVLVLSFAALAFALVGWMSFQPAALRFVASKKILIALGVCGILIPIGFFPTIGKREPRLAIGLSLFAMGGIAAAYAAIAGLIFDLQNGWVELATDLTSALWVMGALAFIWQGIRRSSERQDGEIDRNPK